MRRFHDHNVAVALWLYQAPSVAVMLPVILSWFAIMYLSMLSIGYFLPDETWIESVTVSVVAMVWMFYTGYVVDSARDIAIGESPCPS